jgi:hypothetical protein
MSLEEFKNIYDEVHISTTDHVKLDSIGQELYGYFVRRLELQRISYINQCEKDKEMIRRNCDYVVSLRENDIANLEKLIRIKDGTIEQLEDESNTKIVSNSCNPVAKFTDIVVNPFDNLINLADIASLKF